MISWEIQNDYCYDCFSGDLTCFSATAGLLACVKLLNGVLFSLCKPCKAMHPADVDAMYIELLQRCKQMYLTEAETIDDHLYQLPSFLQSIASVIFHLDTVSGVFQVPVKIFFNATCNA